MTDDLERALGPDRRTFVKRLVIGTAFAAPVVSSFTMTGVQAVFGDAPRSAIMANGNIVTPPPNYPDELICASVGSAGETIVVDDGPVHIVLVVPADAFPSGANVCIFKGDLAALAGEVPSGQTPLSAYGVAWAPTSDAVLALVMTVTNAPVSAGDPVYVFNKTTGAPEQIGTVIVDGTWTASFTDDPGFVVTTPPAGAPPAGAAPEAVTAQPSTTG